MMDILLVGIGGAAGSLARYQLGKLIARKFNSDFPLGTFVINISGAILLGLASGFNTGHNVQLLLADGFLGAYTTFSTFMYEGFNLFHENDKKNAAFYIGFTFLFGIVGFIIGLGISKWMQLL